MMHDGEALLDGPATSPNGTGTDGGHCSSIVAALVAEGD